ncbi:unnamed protein product [Discula destructiva]
MSGQPTLNWPNASANETYIALGLEMPIVGIAGSGPELVFLGAESYLLFMQQGMTASVYDNLNVSDSLLSSSVDPLVSFTAPSGLFADSSSLSSSSDPRLLAVLLYKSNMAASSASQTSQIVERDEPISDQSGIFDDGGESSNANTESTASVFATSSSSSVGGGGGGGDKDSSAITDTAFNWTAWAADMNANPSLRMDFDISDFADTAGLGTPVAAEVLAIKNEDEDDREQAQNDTSGSWDVLSTLWQTPTPTGASVGAASGVGAPVMGLMPSGGGGGGGGGAAGGLATPSGLGSGVGVSATDSPLVSSGPGEGSNGESDGADGAGSGSPGSSTDSISPYGASPSSPYTGASGDSGSDPGAAGPLALTSTAGAAESTDTPSASSESGGTPGDGSDDDATDVTSAPGAGMAGSFPTASGQSSVLNYTASSPNIDNNGGGSPPTDSAAAAGITGGGSIASMLADGATEDLTIGLNLNGEFTTTLTANLLEQRQRARRTMDAKSGLTLTLKTDLVAPTPSTMLQDTILPSSTAHASTRYALPNSTLHTKAASTGSSATSSGVSSSAGLVTSASAAGGEVSLPVISLLGLICVSVSFISFL